MSKYFHYILAINKRHYICILYNLKITFMKKLFTLGLCLIFASAYSQRVSVGLSLGAGKASVNAPFGYTGSTAMRMGVFTDVKITGPLFAGAGVAYESSAIQSTSTTTNASGGSTGTVKNVERCGTVDFPVFIKLKTGVKVNPYFSVGAGPSVLVSAKNYSKGSSYIPNSTTDPNAKTDVSDDYNSMYWALYNAVGIELKGDKITPFFEVRLKHSLSDVHLNPSFGSLNVITANIGFKF
jgi:hypothetical protein